MRVDAVGATDAEKRVEVRATSGVVTVLAVHGESLEVSVKGATVPFDVVATDSVTGVAAWLRVGE